MSLDFTHNFLEETVEIARAMDTVSINKVIDILLETRKKEGRLFILGVGGSAANASHACNDFRKIAGIEAYAPTDNVAELTARTNDEGWATVFSAWLQGSHLRTTDTLMILSVGGGNAEKNVSPNLVAAIDLARGVGSRVVGIVGRDGGYTAKHADACVIIPTVNPDHVTPHSEAFQAVIWHLIVSHPLLKQVQTKWESVSPSVKAVFLDRDGTLTEDQLSPKSLDDLKIASDALASLTVLKDAGFKLVMVTNQPDVHRGIVTMGFVKEINEALSLPLDGTYVCPHTSEVGCDCRKPGTLLFQQAAEELGIDLKRSYMVGDTWRDMEAGYGAGCTTIWVSRPGGASPDSTLGRQPHTVVKSLTGAVAWILEDSK